MTIPIQQALAAPRCWWCGAPANSREHKFKQSELRLNNGRGAWQGDAAVVHGRNGGEELRQVQGPNSTLVKFSTSMCQNCNNARSQPFDQAYDKFIEYLAANEATIAIDRRLRFSDIYGEGWATERVNLIKYWVKHVCCFAAENKLEVPADLIKYLDEEIAGAPPHIRLEFLIQSDLLRLRLNENMPYGSFIGDVMGWSHPEGALHAIEGHLMWGWLIVTWFFDVDEPFGATTFEGNLVQMGWISQVSDEYTLDLTDLMASDLMAHYREQKNQE